MAAETFGPRRSVSEQVEEAVQQLTSALEKALESNIGDPPKFLCRGSWWTVHAMRSTRMSMVGLSSTSFLCTRSRR